MRAPQSNSLRGSRDKHLADRTLCFHPSDSSSSGRAEPSRRMGDCWDSSVTCRIRSRKVGSAQCRSSKSTTTGRSEASPSNSFLADQKISSTEKAVASRPTTDASRSMTGSCSGSNAINRERASSAASPSSIPAACRTISANGQKVMPSP